MALPATMAVYQQIDMAIGVTMKAVDNMQERRMEVFIQKGL